MPRVLVTRRVHWNSAHRLFRPDWSDDRNAEVFGACSNPEWHGHNYELDVTVEGEVDPETGFVMDLSHLRDRVEELVVSHLDHRNLFHLDQKNSIVPTHQAYRLRRCQEYHRTQ